MPENNNKNVQMTEIIIEINMMIYNNSKVRGKDIYRF